MKILTLYASWGWGHKTAAFSLKEALSKRGIESETVDVVRFLPPPFDSLYSISYSLLITNFRTGWKWIYEETDRTPGVYAPERNTWLNWQFTGLLDYLEKQDFTHIVSTHFLTSALLAAWRQQFNWKIKLYSVITDFVAHRYWKRPGLDYYFVATDEVAVQLLLSGIPSQKIKVSGIPVSHDFSQSTSRMELRLMLPFDVTRKLVLVLTSGFNKGTIKRIVQELQLVNAQFLISAGKDAPNEDTVRKLCGQDERFRVFGIAPNLPQLMRSADVLITKPGGVTSSEALAAGVPLILLPPIPGQEEGNAEFLVRSGVAIQADTSRRNLASTVSELLADVELRENMRRSASEFAKPNASRQITDYILQSE